MESDKDTMKMDIYGLRSILLVLLFEIGFILLIFYKKKDPFGFIIMMAAVDLLLFGIITIDSKRIKIYSLVKLLTGKSSFLLTEIEEIKFPGMHGSLSGRLDFDIIEQKNQKTSGFILMYPFESKKLERRLEKTGLKITSW